MSYAIEAVDPGAILARTGSASGAGGLQRVDAEIIKVLYISLASISTL